MTPSQAAQEWNGRCVVCDTGERAHGVMDHPFTHPEDQAAQEKPTSPRRVIDVLEDHTFDASRGGRCSCGQWPNSGERYHTEHVAAAIEREAAAATPHDIGPGYCRTCDPGFGHNNPEAAAATPSLDKIRAALSLARSMILSREPMSAQANAVFEEAFASMGERDAAPTSPSLPDARLLRYALLDLAGLDYAYEARLDSGDYGLLERPNEFAGRLVEAYAAALARLDEGSATPEPPLRYAVDGAVRSLDAGDPADALLILRAAQRDADAGEPR